VLRIAGKCDNCGLPNWLSLRQAAMAAFPNDGKWKMRNSPIKHLLNFSL
jgi:hypothetical protein